MISGFSVGFVGICVVASGVCFAVSLVFDLVFCVFLGVSVLFCRLVWCLFCGSMVAYL